MMVHDTSQRLIRRRARKRVGRGIGSGHGKTCGRGHKGAGSRSGHKVRLMFEGGQMPVSRRIPKRGFSNSGCRAQQLSVVGLESIEGSFDQDEVVDLTTMKLKRLCPSGARGVKILANGTITKRLTVVASSFSRSAADAITAAGGTYSIRPIS
jgi:large subunit ribosomal protein L15